VLVDSVIKHTTKVAFSEVIVLVDTLTSVKVFLKEFLETIVVADSLFKSTGKVLTDVVILVDTAIKHTSHTLLETVVLVDTVVKQAQKTLTDVLVMVDTLATLFIPFVAGAAKNYYTGGISAAKRALRGLGFK
jgi:hypothetical protein